MSLKKLKCVLCFNFDLPAYIRNNKDLSALINNRKGVNYQDHLSLFRRQAVHHGQKSNIET